jgi:uncharacterized membrane protein
VSDPQSFWFPVKRYGWGWGLPVRWQGWIVLLCYVALVLAAAYYFRPLEGSAFAVSILLVTALLVVIVAIKGERPARWRWGND